MHHNTHSSRDFGSTKDGRQATLYAYRDENECGFAISDYGATLVSLLVPDRSGQAQDILLGFDSVHAYQEHDGYMGATCGRFANRIRHGTFSLGDNTYQLFKNEGANHLHGGKIGFDKKFWQIEAIDAGFRANLISPHMDEGYPGNLTADLTFRWVDYSLRITYTVLSDMDTICSLTNHAYFNVNGQQGDARKQKLTLFANSYTPIDHESLPSGEIRPVHGALDIRTEKTIKDLIFSADPSITHCHGIDHNFVIDHASEADDILPAAILYGPTTGIDMTIRTTSPGLQVYTGNSIKSWVGKSGLVYKQHDGIALETQYFPNAINEPAFPSPVLEANTPRTDITIFDFSTRTI